MLLKAQRNVLFNALIECGLSSDIFSEKKTSSSYRITLNNSIYYFTTTPNLSSSIADGDFEINSLPKSENSRWNNGYHWSEVVDCFNKWADAMREEIDTPDLWAEATKTAQLFAPTAEPSDDKFTRTELAEVQGQLRLLQLSFTASALPEAAKQKLIKLTETAAVKAEGFTKKDWQGWFIGSIISSITALAMNPTQAQEVYRLVKAAFGGLFLH